MTAERRQGDRVTFERGISVQIIDIEGTWHRDCKLEDISEIGAKLTVTETSDDLNMKEFFLLLSSTGLAYRRCEKTWQNGAQIGVNFIQSDVRKRKPARRSAGAAES